MSELRVDREGGLVTVTLNRPAALNALDTALKVALRDTLAELGADRRCRAVLLAGEGRAFCVGQDLRVHLSTLEASKASPLDGGTDHPLRTVEEHYNPIVTTLAGLDKPVVAAVRGVAAGAGASLALLADFRVGGPGTSFLMAFAKVGLAGDTGVSWTLPRLVGLAKATELLLLAEPVPAAEAARLGLLTQLTTDDDQVLPEALTLARRLAEGPTVAYGAIKRELAVGAGGTLAEALAEEARAQRLTGGSADHHEGTAAFVAKRPATFQGG
jgi:2-(1,2-epoxy-1,2-dihydrophenyl)acetyl-CoA isomerase